MSLILKLEPMAGDEVGPTCVDIVDVAKRLDMTVQVQFNDVKLISYGGGCAKELADGYTRQVGSTSKYKIATTR